MKARSAREIAETAAAGKTLSTNFFAPANPASSSNTAQTQHLATRNEGAPHSSSEYINANASPTTPAYRQPSISTLPSQFPPFSPPDIYVAQRSIRDFTPAELRAEITLLEAREDQIWEARERQEAILNGPGDAEGAEKREAVWKYGRLKAVLDLQSDRRMEVIGLLEDTGGKMRNGEGDAG